MEASFIHSSRFLNEFFFIGCGDFSTDIYCINMNRSIQVSEFYIIYVVNSRNTKTDAEI